MKPNYGDNVKICYVDTDNLMVHVKLEDVYADLAKDLQKRFDTSNYEIIRPLTVKKNKQVIGLMKDEMSGGIITNNNNNNTKKKQDRV